MQVLRVFQHQVFQAAELLLADFQVFAGVLDLLQLFDALLELDHLGARCDESFFISGVTLLVRSESSSSSFTLRRRRRRIASCSSSCSFLFLPSRSASQSSRLRASICAHRVEVQRDALADRALVGLVLGGADLHRAVERQIAVVDLLEDLDRALKAVVDLQHLRAENLAGDFDLLGQRDFLLAGEQRDLAHLREVHPHRIVDALGRCLGQLLFEVEIDFFFVLVGSLLGDWASAPAAPCRLAVAWRAAWLRPWALMNSPMSASSMSLMPISSIIISSESSLSGETTSSGSFSLSSS